MANKQRQNGRGEYKIDKIGYVKGGGGGGGGYSKYVHIHTKGEED